MYTDERHFVKTAIQKMDYLEKVWTAVDSNEHKEHADHTNSALDVIKTTSASVHARGIYRAAILCEDVLSRLTPDNTMKMNSALVELKQLINLYAGGLFEIDPEFAVLVYQPDSNTQADTHLSDAHAQAVQTLSPLVYGVEDKKLRSALKTLMRPVQIYSAEKPGCKTMSLDALIQPISNLVLSEARHCGKIITVSYAADFTELSFETAETMQGILEASCLKVVSQGIPKPSKIEHGSTPQISLTGQSRGGNILFSISWMGTGLDALDSSESAFNSQMSKLVQQGGTYSINHLALSDNLKSRHTLYIKLPIASTAGFNSIMSQKNAKVEMGSSHHV